LLRWPLPGAVAHTAGSAALVILLTLLILRARQAEAGPNRPGAPALRPNS
jgi:heme A synthase